MNEHVAVLGAGGFLGSRLVEVLHLSGRATVLPIVRRVQAMARASRFDVPVALADTRDPAQLSRTLKGCTSLVDCTVGMPAAIEAAARALIPSAKAAGICRVVYLSSASVHGQNPPLGSDETSALSDRQEMAYNNAKVRAERILFVDAERYGVELFVLRPSIVFGPRDRWLKTLVAELKSGTAWLIENGQGICNTIYVDNLIEAIICCLKAPASAASNAYLVGDAEEVSWRRLYESTAAALGMDFESVQHLPVPAAPVRSTIDLLNDLRVKPTSLCLISAVPSSVKQTFRGALAGLQPESRQNLWRLSLSQPMASPSREMVLLQQCRRPYPYGKATRELRYCPTSSFEEGIQRSMQMMTWAHLA